MSRFYLSGFYLLRLGGDRDWITCLCSDNRNLLSENHGVDALLHCIFCVVLLNSMTF